jgi:competence protein ComEA
MTPRADTLADLAWRRRNLAAVLALCSLAAGALAARSASGRIPIGRHVGEMPDRVLAAREKIDPNVAAACSLQRLRGIGKVRAQAIVDYRDRHGPRCFRFAEDLAKVHGIGAVTLEEIRDDLALPSETALQPASRGR